MASHHEERTMPQRHSEDLPWNDVAADSDTMSTDPEPDPAEVVGDEDDDAEEDLASHRVPDPYEKYRPESLDQRLAEEEPEASPDRAADAEAGELQAPEAGGDDVDAGEDDPVGPDGRIDDAAAEDAAVHIRKRV
jgi:hypothetical protein